MAINHKKAPQRVYLIPKGHKMLADYKEQFDYMIAQKAHTVNLNIAPEYIPKREVAYMQDLITVLQHYPKLMERLIFSFHFKFQQVADSELYFEEEHWKTDPIYYRWFNQMNSTPVAIFFIHDRDARFYCLAGDFIADGKVTIEPEETGKHSMVGFEAEEVQILCDRMFTACWLMHIYCHGSGFNPKHYIEALLAEFDLPIDYKEIVKKYKEDIAGGIKLRIKPEEPFV